MGLFSNRKRRRQARRAKAEAKALLVKAKKEAKATAKAATKRLRHDKKSTTRVEKAQIKTLKAQENHANKEAAKAERDRLSPKEVKKLLGTAKLVAPVAAPMLYQGATWIRSVLDGRAAGSGGTGAQISARISNAETAANAVSARDSASKKFAEATRTRLTELHTAVVAAATMPAPSQKSAHQAISAELSRIEADLLDRLGVH